MRWPLTFYTETSEGFIGEAYGPFIKILPEKKGDEGLYQHEFVHVKQWLVVTLLSAALIFWLTEPVWLIAAPFVHNILVGLSSQYRLLCEIMAYRKQLQYSPGNEGLYAAFIATRYNINISQERAFERLVK